MASNRIKGITIEIDGDTTGLSKALSGVEKTLRATQADLREVNSALKFDSGNVDLLRTKQELLNEKVAASKEKLEKEKQALEQLKASDGFDATSEQAKNLEKQIELDTVALKKAEDELKEFGSVGKQKLQDVANSVKEVGEKVTGFGTSLTTHVTAPIVAVGTASVAAWKEVDSAMDIVTQKTGASGEALEDMQSRVTAIAESIPTSFEAAGTAIGEVNTRFGLTGDALEDLSTKFIEFAELNGTDVNTSIDQTQKVLAAFGLSAEDAGALLDTMNKVGQDTGVSMSTLAQLMVTNGTAFQSLGLNAADAATLLGKLEKSGVDTSTVMTGLSKVQKAAMEDGVTMQEALTSALNDSDTALETFGAKAGPKLYESFKNGALSVEDFVNSTVNLTDALGSVDETYTATLDPLDQMTMTMNTLKQTGADIVNSAAPMLTQVMETLANVVKSVAEAWNSLSPAQQEMIIKVAAIAAAVGPLLVVLGSMITTIGTIMVGVSALLPILMGPVGIIALIVAAVVGLGVAIYKNWDDIKAWAEGVYIAIQEMVTGVMFKLIEIRDNAIALWETIKATVSAKVNELKTNVVNSWNALKTSVITTVQNLKANIISLWENIKSWLSSTVNNIKTNVTTAFDNIKNNIVDRITGAKDAIINGMGEAADYISSLPGKFLEWGSDMIQSLIDGIKSKISGVVDAVSGVAETIASYLHFSVPDKGPLADADTYMPDFIKLMTSGIAKGLPQLESAAATMASALAPTSNLANGVTNNTSTNNVSINVYGAQGQDVSELADIIQDRINMNVYRNGAAFA